MADDHNTIPELETFVRTGQAAEPHECTEWNTGGVCLICGRTIDHFETREEAALEAHELNEPALLARAAAELEAIGPPLELVIQPSNVLQLAGLVQVALRHADVSSQLRGTADRFLSHARDYFAGAPAVLELLARGETGVRHG